MANVTLRFAALVLIMGVGAQVRAAALLRFPNAGSSQVTFVARGELWIAPLTGGVATRLTHDPGDTLAPTLSPDGRWIAFTGLRAGGRDVYVIPAAGGEARRLTFDAAAVDGDNLVVGFTPDSQQVLFLSSRGAPNYAQFRAFSVAVSGGQPQMLPLDRAGLMSFSPDRRAVAYNRIFRNFELRKRYMGGQHQNIYTYEFHSKRLTRLTRWRGTDTAPMWYGHQIYFLSDRDSHFRANIWVYDLDTGHARQITHFRDYDVDWPSLGAGGISFQEAGKLYLLDLPAEHLRELQIDVPDDGERDAAHVVSAGDSLRVSDALGGVDYSISPDGTSMLVSAHGHIVQVPAHGTPTDLSQTPGVDEDHPAWSPDGQLIAYSTDVDGEQQIAVKPATGGQERLLTHSSSGYFYSPTWSPDGDFLAVADANHRLWLASIKGLPMQLIAQDPYAEIRDAAFSPDGRWLSYSTQRSTRVRAIHVHELASGRDWVVSSPMESDRFPTFTRDGRFLAFVSQRNELPLVSDRHDESLVTTLNSDGIYLAPLGRLDAAPGKGTPEVAPREGKGSAIDLDGLMARAVALAVTPSVINSLEARGDELFYETSPPQLIGGDLPGAGSALRAINLNTLSDRTIVEGLKTHSLSADGSTVVFQRDGVWRIRSTREDSPVETVIDVSTIHVPADPKRDWSEMLQNAWRLDRDVFFSAAMNGSNWRTVRDVYARLWPLISSEGDFFYLLGQMQGEIASSHTFIRRGKDFDPRPRETVPLLGANFELDPASGRYRISRLFPGDPTRAELRAPLGAPALDVHQGDYLLAVNGLELRAPAAPMSVLVGQKGPLRITIADYAEGERRTLTVDPVTDDLAIRHLEWIKHNRVMVDQLSQGKIGYVALSDFSEQGSKEFVRQFYPQLDKQGLIFDVRWNRGGFTSQAVLETLRRQLQGVYVNRESALSSLPTATPPPAMVTVINDASHSDGDQFPYFFRKYGLGPLVGERTWGGVQGINGPWRLMDGTLIFIPKDSLADLRGHWIIENEGVTPDTAVQNPPESAAGVRDLQLEAAVRACLRQLTRRATPKPRIPAPLPAYPASGDVPGASFIDRSQQP